MTPLENLRTIAADPLPRKTAREIIEARLGRDLGPIRDMPRDTRRALYRVAKTLQELKGNYT